MFVITLWAPKSNEKAHSAVILSNKIGEFSYVLAACMYVEVK